MAADHFRAFSQTVSTSPTKLGPTGGETFIVRVPSGGSTVYLGDASVDTTEGFPVEAGESFAVSDGSLGAGSLHAVVASSTQDVNIIVGA